MCPSKLHKGLFTTAAVGNIDHNPSSTTSQDSFHGTISLVQHPTSEVKGGERNIDTFDVFQCISSKKVAQLPSCYHDVPPVTVPSTELYAPKISGRIKFHPIISELGKEEEKDWLQNAKELLWREEHNHHGTMSWAAYCSLQATPTLYWPAIIAALLPMFVENAHLLAMIKHSTDVIRAAVHHVNPAQIPVIAFDQPLFALT